MIRTWTVGAVVLIAVGVGVGGCGSSGDGNEASTTATTKPKDRPAPTRSREDVFVSCVKRAGLTFKKNVSGNVEGRAPISLKGPAEYIGAGVGSNAALTDFWIANSPSDAQRMADRINTAVAKEQGVAEVEAAYAEGIMVGAAANNGKPLDLDVAGKVDRCIKRVSGL